MESLDNLFTLAEQAETVKNYQEAYQYYNRILEINPKNPKALIGKRDWPSAGYPRLRLPAIRKP